MHGLNIAALVAATATLCAASPVRRATGGFSVNQVAGKKVLLSGPVAYRNALAKYNATIPSRVQIAAAASQSGSVTANPAQYDSEYLCPVSVGGTEINLDFDTGSADLWVFSTELPAAQSNGHTPLYDPSKSGTKLDGATWDISYGDGSGASGDVYADTVVIGGVTATSQAVEAATSVSGQFEQNTDNNGLVGLAFSSINTVKPTQQKTFFDTVADSLPQQLFTCTLKKGAPGSYDFGYIDDSKHTGDITYVPVDNSQGFWSFTVDKTSVSSGSLTGIADTGTTLILVDESVVDAYYQSVSGAQNSQQAGGYVFSCDTTPPDFTMTIGGADFIVPGSYINFAPNGDGTCFGGIQSNQGIGINIFGDVFLKNQFVVFDAGNNQLGFAPQAGGDSGDGSPTSSAPPASSSTPAAAIACDSKFYDCAGDKHFIGSRIF